MNYNKHVAVVVSILMLFTILFVPPQYMVTADEPDPPENNNWWIYPEIQPYQIFSPPQFNWSKFWQVFKNHAVWDMEYNQGSGWISCKQNLTIIRDYLEDNTCKFTLDFTAPYTADYRLTLAIDYRVKQYINRSAQYEYTLTYDAFGEDFNVVFNWSDIAEIPGIIITKGIKNVGGHDYFWLRARRNNVQKDTHVVLDPTYEIESGSQIFNEFNSQRKLAQDSTGTIWACYERISDVFIAYSDDDGQTWTNTLVFGADVSNKPSIAIDSDDFVHLVFSGQHPGQATYNQIRYSNSSNWAIIVNLTNIANYQYSPSIAIDSSDNIHVVWENTTPQGTSNDDQVSYINFTNGVWSPIQMLTNEANSADDIWHPMIAVNNTGSLHVIFECEDFANGWDQILHMQSDDGGISWSAWNGDAITNDASHNQLIPCIAIGDDDTMYVAWTGEFQANSKNQIGYSYNDSSGWSTAEWLTDDSVLNQYSPSISVDEMGIVHVVWRDGASSAIHYKYNDTISWSNEIDITTTGSDINPSILHSQTPTINGLKTNSPATRFVFTYAYSNTKLYFTNYSTIWRNASYPVQYNPQPMIEETEVSLSLNQFNISISDPEGDTMDLTFRTNESGTWRDINTTLTNQANGTYNATNASWIDWSTEYFWSVNLTDGTYWSNETYYFTVELDIIAPAISGLLPSHQNMTQTSPVTLSVTLDDPENNTDMTLNWMSGETNTIMSTNSSISDGTYTYEWACGEGTHQWYINVSDSFGNSANSSAYWFACNSTWSDDFYNYVLIDSFDSNYTGARIVVTVNSSYANFTSDLYNNTVAEGLDGTERTFDLSMYDSTDDYGASPRIVFINSTHGYAFGCDVGVSWYSTIDGGITWTDEGIYGDTMGASFAGAVWYDRWTTGDNGTKIHLAGTPITDTTDGTYYNYFDTVLGTENTNWVKVLDDTTITPPDGGAVITKASDGRLWIGGFASDPLGGRISYSDDDGATWTENTPTSYFDDDDNHMQLLPLPDGDVMCIYQDGQYLRYTIYSKNTDSWSSFSVIDEGTGTDACWGASMWKQTGDIYLASREFSSVDIMFWKYTISNSTWWGYKVINETVFGYGADASIVVSQGNGDIYVFWTDGDWGTMDVFCSNSTDAGMTWSTEVKINTVTDDYRYTTGNFMSEYKIYASWHDDDDNDWRGTSVRNYTLGAKITDAYSNLTSVNITKPSGYTWDRFNCDVNTTTNTTFSILDENGTAQLTGLDGNNNDISSVTNSTIKIWGQLNNTRNMNIWNVTFTSEAPANSAPTLAGESPSNESTTVDVSGGVPDLYVICNDADAGDTLTATFSSNSSETWYDFATNVSISPGTNITQSNPNLSAELTTYYWRVNLTDGEDSTYAIYHFTTLVNDTTSPYITINFAGNLSDSGGPYWRPPGESDILDEAGEGIWRDGYYTNDSRQQEDWIYINLTVNDSESPATNVWLQWLNETTWTNYTYAFANTVDEYWEYNTSGNIQTAEGYDYSFNIVANSSGGSNTTWWNKTVMYGNFGSNNIIRRFVQLNCTPVNITYTPYYLIKINETHHENEDYSKHDRLHHDQGTDGTATDTGYLRTFTPLATVENIYCGTFWATWFDESQSVEPFTLDNIYYHVWWSSDNDIIELGWRKIRTSLVGAKTDSFSTNSGEEKSNISYDGGTANDYYSLTTNLLDVTNTDVTENDIYEVYITGIISANNPSAISNRSFGSFVLFNVPDNATLNASHADTDSDSLSDWTELYVTYTNPFLADTDNDGVSDYTETFTGSDPNNYTDTVEEFIWIDITNVSWAIGMIAPGASDYTNETSITFIADIDNCTVNTDLSLQITTDGATWKDASAPSTDEYRVNASIDIWVADENLLTEVGDTTISSDITSGQNETFDLRFDAPTATSTGVQQTITITATIVKH